MGIDYDWEMENDTQVRIINSATGELIREVYLEDVIADYIDTLVRNFEL